jgi:hypothetical protein
MNETPARPVNTKQLLNILKRVMTTHGNLPVRIADDWSDEGEEVESGLDVASVTVQSVKNNFHTGTIKVVFIKMV